MLGRQRCTTCESIIQISIKQIIQGHIYEGGGGAGGVHQPPVSVRRTTTIQLYSVTKQLVLCRLMSRSQS